MQLLRTFLDEEIRFFTIFKDLKADLEQSGLILSQARLSGWRLRKTPYKFSSFPFFSKKKKNESVPTVVTRTIQLMKINFKNIEYDQCVEPVYVSAVFQLNKIKTIFFFSSGFLHSVFRFAWLCNESWPHLHPDWVSLQLYLLYPLL